MAKSKAKKLRNSMNNPFNITGIKQKTARVAIFVMTVTLVGVWTLLFTQAASNDAEAEEKQYSLHNQHRGAKGVRSLFRTNCINDAAREWAAYMADKEELSHGNYKALVKKHCKTSSYTGIAENVSLSYGSGASTGENHHNQYMRSADHKASIEDPDYNFVGVGTMQSKTGKSYNSTIFVACEGCGEPFTTAFKDTKPNQQQYNPVPEGNIDNVSCSNITGWALDKSDTNKALEVHVYIGGSAESGAPGYSTIANINRGDVGAHGWSLATPSDFNNTQSYRVHVYTFDHPTGNPIELKSGNGNSTIGPCKAEPVTEKTPPTTPGNFHISGASSTKLELKWVSSKDDIGVTHYVLGISGGGRNDSVKLRKNVTGYFLSNLTPNTRYSFTLSAFDASGKSSPAATTSYTTHKATVTRSIIGVGSNRCLDVQNGRDTDGANIQIYDCLNNSNQLWTLSEHPDGSFEIRTNVGSKSRCLDVPGAQANNGQKLTLYSCNGTGAQKWYFNGGSIQSAVNRKKVLDVEGVKTSNGALVQLWDDMSQTNQQWR